MTPDQEAKQIALLDAIYCALLTLTNPKPYNITGQVYNQGGAISSNCMDMLFINTGTNTLMLNNTIPLLPGAGYSTNANLNEVDKTPWAVSFKQDNTGLLTNSLTVVKKVYI